MAARPGGGDKGEAVKQRIRAAGERARREAEERRKATDAPQPRPEANGRGGPDPVRYGDWEKKGIASDF